MATCTQLDDYMAGRLASADAQAFEAHADSCAACGKIVARQRAVERAAKVLQRNQASRGSRDDPAALPVPAQREPPVAARSPLTPALSPEHDARRHTTESRGRERAIAIGVVIVLLAGGALLLRPKAQAPGPQPDPRPAETTPSAVNTEPEPPLLPPPPNTPPATDTPAPASSTKPAKPAAAVTDSAPSESLPLDTDLETLTEVVASKRCAPAVAPLRARIGKDGKDARAWALLTQCYVKRKRWKNTLEAYDMVVRWGDAALVESLQATADVARAELEASDGVAVTPASP